MRGGAGSHSLPRFVLLSVALLAGIFIGAVFVLNQSSLDDGIGRRGFRTHKASPLPVRSSKLAVETDGDTGGSGLQLVSAPSIRPDAFAALSLSPEEGALQREIRMDEVVVEALSWKPRIFHLHNFLTAAECDKLISLGRPQLEKSTVVDISTGQGMLSQVRTSSGTFLTDNQDPVLDTIRKRISHVVLLPEENQEAMSILRYEPGQYYRPHEDFFADQFNKDRGGQRTATVLMYLTEPEDGGETIFPLAGGAEMCDCGGSRQKGLCVKPRKGNAVLFWTMTPDGHEDDATLHGSCEVVKGEKWSATKWIRTGKFV